MASIPSHAIVCDCYTGAATLWAVINNPAASAEKREVSLSFRLQTAVALTGNARRVQRTPSCRVRTAVPSRTLLVQESRSERLAAIAKQCCVSEGGKSEVGLGPAFHRRRYGRRYLGPFEPARAAAIIDGGRGVANHRQGHERSTRPFWNRKSLWSHIRPGRVRLRSLACSCEKRAVDLL